MIDSRLTPANTRVAASRLEGTLGDDMRSVDGVHALVGVPVADLRRAPDGSRDRQLKLGEGILVYEAHEGWAFVEAQKDGYVGYLRATSVALSAPPPTHRVAASFAQVYAKPDIKSRDLLTVPFAARLHVEACEGTFARCAQGHVPLAQLRPVEVRWRDPVAVAELHLHTPYLWGGNSTMGIDCSGLVQEALIGCGIDCPADSDLQERALGDELPADTEPRRGDLLFWKGHVAIACDRERMIHANANGMKVEYEGIAEGRARILAQGGGAMTSHRRLPLPGGDALGEEQTG